VQHAVQHGVELQRHQDGATQASGAVKVSDTVAIQPRCQTPSRCNSCRGDLFSPPTFSDRFCHLQRLSGDSGSVHDLLRRADEWLELGVSITQGSVSTCTNAATIAQTSFTRPTTIDISSGWFAGPHIRTTSTSTHTRS